jgi:UrcA family protein
VSHFVTRAAGALVFAVAFAGAAQAAPVTVKVADINTLSADGAQVYDARVERAAAKFCAPVRASGGRLAEFNDCLAGVRVEMSEKLQLRNADLAKRGTGTTLAAAD